MHGPTSHLYFSQRLRLHYVDWGNAGAPHLLMIHGGRDHCRNWDWVAERLKDRYHIIAPDLRGHGDSEWATGAGYNEIHYIYDIAQLVHQKKMAPVTIVAHSLGGSIALLYAGLYPETIAKVVAIEGLGPSPKMLEQWAGTPVEDRVRGMFEARRKSAGRSPRKYASIEDAVTRMKEENAHLNEAQARHLTLHGALQNEDGTWSWKFDNMVRMGGPGGLSVEDQRHLWGRIAAPVLLVRGTESWASDPVADGRIAHFKNARLANIESAGHWSHHDQFDVFMAKVEAFLAA
ncbi:MAG TPA: alpha/beta hydrolase [Rhizomicrobium sp.]|jgi:pimeloyl-ACP methyl ester carboxylesterase|nr:alpha/beta hydrolase [Rhizomicrobium sp.]